MDTKPVNESVALSILSAWKNDGTPFEVPWHITNAAWVVYADHPSEKVRQAALKHPYYNCPEDELQKRREDFRTTVKTYA